MLHSAPEASGIVLATPTSFPFPFAKPYDIQVQLMQTVFQAIEERKIAIVRDRIRTVELLGKDGLIRIVT